MPAQSGTLMFVWSIQCVYSTLCSKVLSAGYSTVLAKIYRRPVRVYSKGEKYAQPANLTYEKSLLYSTLQNTMYSTIYKTLYRTASKLFLSTGIQGSCNWSVSEEHTYIGTLTLNPVLIVQMAKVKISDPNVGGSNDNLIE